MALVIIACITIPLIYLVTFVWKLLCYAIPFFKCVGIIAMLVGCPVFTGFAMHQGIYFEPGFETIFGYVFISLVYLVVWVVLWLLTSPLHMFFGMLNTARQKPKFSKPIVT